MNRQIEKCCYCLAEITPDNENLPRIDYRETEILNLKQQVQNLQSVVLSLRQQCSENQIRMESLDHFNEANFNLIKKHNLELLKQLENYVNLEKVSSNYNDEQHIKKIERKNSLSSINVTCLVGSNQTNSLMRTFLKRKKSQKCPECSRICLNKPGLLMHLKHTHKK